MQCDICGAALNPDSISCPECEAPVLQNVEGFEYTTEVQRILKSIVVERGRKVVVTIVKLTGLLFDYLPEYEKERKLLVTALKAEVLRDLFAAKDLDDAAAKARERMKDECGFSENEAEFVLACYTYMLKKPYLCPLRVEEPEELPEDKTNKKEEKSRPLDIDAKVFRPFDAIKFRLAKKVNIAEGYTKIQEFCFDGFGFMRTVNFPSTLLAIGEYAFSGCKHLEKAEIPPSVKIIQQGAFSQCLDLKEVKIPYGILEIEDNTFLCCQSLETVEVPPTVSSIGAQAFSGCDNLKKLVLPESVKFIDENAFLYCPDLTIRCYENSYVHKYCLKYKIKVETAVIGTDLREHREKKSTANNDN